MATAISVLVGGVLGAYLYLSVALLLRPAGDTACAGLLGVGGYFAFTLAAVTYSLGHLRRGALAPDHTTAVDPPTDEEDEPATDEPPTNEEDEPATDEAGELPVEDGRPFWAAAPRSRGVREIPAVRRRRGNPSHP